MNTARPLSHHNRRPLLQEEDQSVFQIQIETHMLSSPVDLTIQVHTPTNPQPGTRPYSPSCHCPPPSSDQALCYELHCYHFTGKLSDPACFAQADKVVWKVMGII